MAPEANCCGDAIEDCRTESLYKQVPQPLTRDGWLILVVVSIYII